MTAGQGPVDPDWSRAVGRATRAVSLPTPPVLAWWWRWEIGLLVVIWLSIHAAVRALGWEWTAGFAVCLVTGVAGRPTARRALVARAWCIVTPHRVRTGCAEAWVHSRSGRRPTVLWTACRSYGEQVVLWCHAGTTAADLVAARDVLAVACWAREIRVAAHPHHPHIVLLKVVRRPVDDPLRAPSDRGPSTRQR